MIILDFFFLSLKGEKLLFIIYRQHTLIVTEHTRRKRKKAINSGKKYYFVLNANFVL
jgi:guanylate kinase